MRPAHTDRAAAVLAPVAIIAPPLAKTALEPPPRPPVKKISAPGLRLHCPTRFPVHQLRDFFRVPAALFLKLQRWIISLLAMPIWLFGHRHCSRGLGEFPGAIQQIRSVSEVSSWRPPRKHPAPPYEIPRAGFPSRTAIASSLLSRLFSNVAWGGGIQQGFLFFRRHINSLSHSTLVPSAFTMSRPFLSACIH